MNSVLRVANLEKHYFDRAIINNINFSLLPGCFYVLLGRNGVGKSTLMRIIMGHESAGAGEVEFLGQSRSAEEGHYPSGKIGFVSETLTYQLGLPIGRLFEKVGEAYERWDHALFLQFLADFGLHPDSFFANLSRGQRMQVAFAAAAALHPKLYLLDEITSVLDADARNRVLHYLREEVRAGASVLLTTNIVSEAQHYADHLLLMEKGRISLDAEVEKVAERFCKIRRLPSDAHLIFEPGQSVKLGANSDDSVSHIVEKVRFQALNPPERFVDQRKVTLEEIFLYFNRNQAA
jgi:ABC-type multidrug transport system ATPase subunit